jgi:hypothetical protein
MNKPLVTCEVQQTIKGAEIEERRAESMPMKNPTHPGDFIRTEIIQPAGLSVTAGAAAL